MRRGGWRAVLPVVVLSLAGCGASSDEAPTGATPTPTSSRLASDCRAGVSALLDTTQRYLESIDASNAAPATAAPSSSASPSPSPPVDLAQAQEEFERAVRDVQSYAASLGCEQQAFSDDLAAGLRALRAGSPVADAVLLQLRAASEPPAADPVPAGGDVALAVAGAEPGATVRLAAGEHVVDETLALLRGVTLVGAGRDATTLRSAAAAGTVLVLAADPVVLQDLTLARGDAPGNVVSATPTASLRMVGVRVMGARSVGKEGGGIGVLLSAGPGGQVGPSRRTTLTMSDSEVIDNSVAGVVASGEHRVEISASGFSRDGQCAVCFLGTSDGVLTGGTVDAASAGVVVSGAARPAVRGVTFSGGEVGLQMLEDAAPEVDGITVRAAARAGLLFADRSAGSVRGVTCTDVPFGLVVGPQAAPAVDGNTGCELARGQ